MLRSEFIHHSGVDVTQEQYAFIEKEYNAAIGKSQYEFCKEWLHNGGINRLIRWEKEQYEIERMKENGENQHT